MKGRGTKGFSEQSLLPKAAVYALHYNKMWSSTHFPAALVLLLIAATQLLIKFEKKK